MLYIPIDIKHNHVSCHFEKSRENNVQMCLWVVRRLRRGIPARRLIWCTLHLVSICAVTTTVPMVLLMWDLMWWNCPKSCSVYWHQCDRNAWNHVIKLHSRETMSRCRRADTGSSRQSDCSDLVFLGWKNTEDVVCPFWSRSINNIKSDNILYIFNWGFCMICDPICKQCRDVVVFYWPLIEE